MERGGGEGQWRQRRAGERTGVRREGIGVSESKRSPHRQSASTERAWFSATCGLHVPSLWKHAARAHAREVRARAHTRAREDTATRTQIHPCTQMCTHRHPSTLPGTPEPSANANIATSSSGKTKALPLTCQLHGRGESPTSGKPGRRPAGQGQHRRIEHKQSGHRRTWHRHSAVPAGGWYKVDKKVREVTRNFMRDMHA